MAGEVKISALPLAGAAADADVTAGVQGGVTVKQTNSALETYMDSKLQVSGNFLLSANNLSDLKNVPTARTNLGLGSAAVQNISFFLQSANNLSDLTNATTARTNLGLGTAAVEDVEFFTLQEAWDVSSPKEIKFTLGSGLAFVNSTDNNLLIVSDAAVTVLEPFVVSVTGSDGLSVIQTTDPDSTFFEIKSTTFGSIPAPVMTNTQRNAIDVTSNPFGLEVFNNTYKTIDYYTGTEWQNILTTQNINGTGTITVTNNGNGTVTVNGSGGSVPDAATSSFSIQNNSTATIFAVQNTFYPIYLGSIFSVDQSSDFTNSFLSIAGMSTPIMTYTGATTQFFNVNISISARGAVPSTTTCTFSIYIRLANGTIVPTQYRGILTLSDLINFYDLSLTGNVSLSTGDAIFVEVQNISNTNSIYAAYATFSAISVSGSISDTDGLPQGTNHLYLSQNGGSSYQNVSGAGVVNNLPKFNSTGGQLIDSGIAAANIVQTTGSYANPAWITSLASSKITGLSALALVGTDVSGNLTNTALTGDVTSVGTATTLASSGISKVISITLVTSSVQMTDSAPINRYILQSVNPCTLTLPTSLTSGHSFEIIGGGGGDWTIAQNASQKISTSVGGSPVSTTMGIGGSVASSNLSDCITLNFNSANTFIVVSEQTSGAGLIFT